MDLELRDALLKTVRRLRARPEPRHLWDDLARDAAAMAYRLRNLFKSFCMLRAALAQAQRQSPEDFAETRAAVHEFFVTAEELVMRGFDLPVAACRAQAAADVIEETSEAIAAVARYAASPTPMNEAKAREETQEAAQASTWFARLLAKGQWLKPVNA